MFDQSQVRSTSSFPIVQVLLTFLLVLLGSQFFAPQFNSKDVILRSVFVQVGFVFGVPFSLSHYLKLNTHAAFKLKQPSIRNVVLSILTAVSLVFILEETTFIQSRVFGVTSDLQTTIIHFLRVDDLRSFSRIFLSVVVVPALCEEYFFRGFILNRLLLPGRTGQAIMLSSVLFGVFHRNLETLFNNTTAGIVLSLIVIRSGSLFNSVLVHAVVNGIAVVLANSRSAPFFLTTGQRNHVPAVLLAVAFVGMFFGIKGLRYESRTNSSS